MTWGKIDDALAMHPKVLKAGNEAMGLWVRCLSYCSQQLTDGHVPEVMVEVMGGRDAAERLVESGLWHPAEGGWVFHDWDEYQPTRATVRAEREAGRKRQQAWRERKSNQGGRDAVTNPVSHTVGNSAPSRPVPTIKRGDADAPPAPKPRAQRLPEGWAPTAEDMTWAKAEAPSLNMARELEKFHDYWQAKGGRDAAKLDWSRTWRNWVRRAAESMPQGGRQVAEQRAVAQNDTDQAERRERQKEWLEARGSTLEEYEKRKGQAGWLDGLRAMEVN